MHSELPTPPSARTPPLPGFAVAAAVAACGFVAAIFPIFESDLFWHLAAGRWIFEQGTLPRTDPFRFTSGAAPWIDHEWVFQLLVRLVERAAGLDGLIVLRATALALFALVLLFVGRRAGLSSGLAGALALAALLGVRPRFLIRPELVTLFALVALLALLERREARRRAEAAAGVAGPLRRDDLLLVLLTVVWVNCHGEALLAPAIVALFLVGAALDDRANGRGDDRADGRGDGWRRWREIAALPLLCGVALLGNPSGWRLIEVPLGIRRALSGLRASNPEWNSSFESPQPYLFAGLIAVVVLALAARRRAGRWVALDLALPAAALAALALTGVRHQALFFAAAAPFAAHALARLAPAPSRERDRWLAGSVVVAALAVALWCAMPPQSGPLRARHGGLHWGFGLAPGRFPLHAAERLAAAPALGPIYNEFAHGGYLLWRLYPLRRVFLDGRMELEPELLGELERARTDARSWEALLRREGAVGALVRYLPRPVPIAEPDGRGGFRVVGESTANTLLFPADRWRLVDWDDDTMLFLLSEATGWTGEPYRAVRPEDVEGTVRRAANDPAYRVELLAELERKLAEQPDCRRALWLRSRLATMVTIGAQPGPES